MIEEYDLKAINNLLKNKDVDLEKIKIFLDENNQIKDTNNEKLFLTVVKYIIMNINPEDSFKTFHIATLKGLDVESMEYIYKNYPNVNIYIPLNKNCPQHILEDALTKTDSKETFLPRIENIDILKSYITPETECSWKESIMNNKLCDSNMLKDIVLSVDETKTKYGAMNLYRSAVESPLLNQEILEIISDKAEYCIAEIGLNPLISNKIIEKIMNYEYEGSNHLFARANLISNPNVSDEIKCELLSNREKYEINKDFYFTNDLDEKGVKELITDYQNNFREFFDR